MHEFIIVPHIVTMVASMALMTGALTLGFFGKKIAVKAATAGMILTILGFITGIILMADAPLSLQCAKLTAYVAAVTILYRFGYGFGDIKKARFVRAES